jgi:ubiquitin C-terminal hydrolase
MRNKSVRRLCYELILLTLRIVGDIPDLCEKVLRIEVKEKSKEDEYVDFRNQVYIGLVNLGSTCYINALLQQLYHTKFSKLLLEKGSDS